MSFTLSIYNIHYTGLHYIMDIKRSKILIFLIERIQPKIRITNRRIWMDVGNSYRLDIRIGTGRWS